MNFEETAVGGAFVISTNRIGDARGYFGRLWCSTTVGERGLETKIDQTNVGFSPRAGTLRGLHYQRQPHEEVKVIRCTRGSVYAVVLDIREDSPTFRKWHGVELNPDNGFKLYMPEGCAAGYLTLEDDSEIYYSTSKSYAPEAATGVRFNDPYFAIEWPREVQVISENDESWPDFSPLEQLSARQK
jgi:dTDP-4-dehydrorhamnose 3,5-epimerase